MALDLFDQSLLSRPPQLSITSIARPVRRLVTGVTRLLSAYRRHRDLRAFEGLPHDMLKDIGYRSAHRNDKGTE
ncbi:hypothetical protein SAMN05880582_101981 [Rhizobium sp. RU20A]|uniref:hypothetical protein n=1 Tax=Rhizobium sp. RU20A TaxID=1907412 RepID=UPI0009553D12|nr:hypothetical protein [Rhizobium sp. RU20A]SIQ16830.1 hypothetical protein SAMN05880582_101981 [Rhizobium sp. RU20A]